ncbi:hypothetical protein V8G57_12650 [Collimonas sp. H4R21]|jgi:hypothetical protein|uniref:Uncharacterized protein n=1 Tax=Collimonas rhizosphaerae TaxID=3126357 RepID=A0ABU9PWB0_9BURK|nr:hypothetical protein [Collimonas sp. OK412]SFC98921.1 hypothetical protein SAMN04515619_11871 [Collimonas sp. OK412]
MGKILFVLALAGLAAGMPNRAIADAGIGIGGTAPFYAPPALYGAELHPAQLFQPPAAVIVAPVWRERNEWEKRRVEQWAEIERHRQEWRETHGSDANGVPIRTDAARGPTSSSNF